VSAGVSVQELVKTYPGTRKAPAVEAVRGGRVLVDGVARSFEKRTIL